MEFQPTTKPTHSPWGHIQNATQIMAGVWSVDTAGHGGFLVSNERLQASHFLRKWKDFTFNGQGKSGWFEEDCDWCLIPLAFPDEWEKWRGLQAVEDMAAAAMAFDRYIRPKLEGAA
jgi:hypothetical protein